MSLPSPRKKEIEVDMNFLTSASVQVYPVP
jgi:hypothetical protein